MSLLINDELIWVSIPKNASHSIEESLLNSNLEIKRPSIFHSMKYNYESNNINKIPHPHIRVDKLKLDFGNKETFCIKREFSDRFISSMEFIWDKITNFNNHTPIVSIGEIDNEYLYSLFDIKMVNNLYDTSTKRNELWFDVYCKLVKEDLNFNNTHYSVYESLCTLISQNFITNSKKCTYEFDISNLDEYVEFINKKFNVEIKINKLNSNKNKNKSKIINNNEFKDWLYNRFEKKFDTDNKNLI